MLGLGKVHSLRNVEYQTDALVAGRDVGKADAKLGFATCYLIIIVGTRVFLQMVDVVDRQATGYGRLVAAMAIGEGGVEADHGQIVGLEFALECLEGFACERTFFHLLEFCGNLVTGVGYLLAIEGSVQKLRSARLHLSGVLDRT